MEIDRIGGQDTVMRTRQPIHKFQFISGRHIRSHKHMFRY